MHPSGKLITLIVAFILLFPVLAYGQSYYLDVPGIPGEVTEARYKDQICITSFSWNVEVELTASGGGRSDAKAGIFKFGKSFDRASPLLFGTVTSGKLYPLVTFTVVVTDGMTGMRELAVYELKVAQIIGFQPGGEAGSIPKEVISLIAEEVKITHFSQNPDGSMGPQTTYEWNFDENTGG